MGMCFRNLACLFYDVFVNNALGIQFNLCIFKNQSWKPTMHQERPKTWSCYKPYIHLESFCETSGKLIMGGSASLNFPLLFDIKYQLRKSIVMQVRFSQILIW